MMITVIKVDEMFVLSRMAIPLVCWYPDSIEMGTTNIVTL